MYRTAFRRALHALFQGFELIRCERVMVLTVRFVRAGLASLLLLCVHHTFHEDLRLRRE